MAAHKPGPRVKRLNLYGINEDELSKQWIAHALTLAHYHEDGGDMERELQKRQISLKFDS